MPVGLYSATARKDLSFRLLHKKDESPVEYRRVCKEEGVELPWSEIVKGYETIDITAVVPQGDIDLMFLEQPYYLAPEGKSAVKAYALLRDALRENKRVGIATIVMREQEHLAALEPVGEAIPRRAVHTRRRAA